MNSFLSAKNYLEKDSHVIDSWLIILGGLWLFLAAFVNPVSAQDMAQNDDRTLFIASGPAGSVNYHLAGWVSALLQQRQRHPLTQKISFHDNVQSTQLANYPSAGSIANIHLMTRGMADFGLVQGDWLYHSQTGGHAYFPDGMPEDRLNMIGLAAVSPVVMWVKPGEEKQDFANILNQGRLHIIAPHPSAQAVLETISAEIQREKRNLSISWSLPDNGIAEKNNQSDAAKTICSTEIDAVLTILPAQIPTQNAIWPPQKMHGTCQMQARQIPFALLKTVVQQHPYLILLQEKALDFSDIIEGQEYALPAMPIYAITDPKSPPKIINQLSQSLKMQLSAQKYTVVSGAKSPLPYHPVAQAIWQSALPYHLEKQTAKNN